MDNKTTKPTEEVPSGAPQTENPATVGLQPPKRKARLQPEAANTDPSKPGLFSSRINPKGQGQATIAHPKQLGGNKTSWSKKRVRSSTSTLSVAQNQKRMRRHDSTSTEHSYREVAASHLRVAVIDVQHPLGKLTADQVEMVQNGLMGALDRQLEQCLASKRQAATISSIKYSGELLRITCEDEMSLE